MDKNTQAERINAICERFFEARPMGLLGVTTCYFDTRKPNAHDNKSDFLAEKRAVDVAIQQATGLIDFISARLDEKSEYDEMSERVHVKIDENSRKKHEGRIPKSVMEMIRKNASDFGVSFMLLFILFDYRDQLNASLQDLIDQEEEFWSGASRPPNHFARIIALRFARLIAYQTNKKPTFGTSKDGGHPSTDFGRALEEVYEILSISANVKRAAKWAIKQLNEADLAPPQNALAQKYAALRAPGPSPRGALSEYAATLPKGQKQ